MNKVAVTQAHLKRAFAVAAERGLPVAAIRCNPDGSTDLLIGDPLTVATAPEPLPEEDPWEAYDRKHGYG